MVPVRTLMVFRDSQHDQHGKQHHQQTHNLHGDVCGKQRASRCAFNYHTDLLIQWLQTDIPLKVTKKEIKLKDPLEHFQKQQQTANIAALPNKSPSCCYP